MRVGCESHDYAALRAAADEPHDFVWVGLSEPTEAELADVADAFALHPLAVEDALNAHQRPKLERYDDSLFLTLRTLWYVDEDDAVETGEINMFVGDDYVVTVRHGAGSELHTRRIDLEADTQVLLHGPSAVVYAVCDRVVDDYEAVAASLEEDVDEVESSVFSPGPHQRLRSHLHPEARDRRDATGGGAAEGADAAVRRGRGQGHRPRGDAVLPRRLRPRGPHGRDHRRARQPADRGVPGAPGPDLGAAERGHAQDLRGRRPGRRTHA